MTFGTNRGVADDIPTYHMHERRENTWTSVQRKKKLFLNDCTIAYYLLVLVFIPACLTLYIWYNRIFKNNTKKVLNPKISSWESWWDAYDRSCTCHGDDTISYHSGSTLKFKLYINNILINILWFLQIWYCFNQIIGINIIIRFICFFKWVKNINSSEVVYKRTSRTRR